jgi:ribosomal protein L11 methyltransferase
MEAPERAFAVLEIWGPESAIELALVFLVARGSTGAEEDVTDGHYKVYFPASTILPPVIENLESAFPELSHRILPGIPDRDWLSEWKKTLTGIALGERFFVHPTWQSSPEIGRDILRIDPEQAFGTGLHDTTRLSIELLERWVRPGANVLDVGAGTGILAMVAARLGARSVHAIEPDPEAAACARRNVLINDLARLVTVECIGFEACEHLSADIVVANVNRPVLCRALARLDGDVVILSGLLVEEVDELIAELPPAYALSEEWSAGEWSALVLMR